MINFERNLNICFSELIKIALFKLAPVFGRVGQSVDRDNSE